MSLVQSFGLGRNAAGKIRGFGIRLESKLETLDGGWISRCTCVNYNTIAIKLLIGNSGCKWKPISERPPGRFVTPSL